MQCQHCGTTLPPEDIFCEECGMRVQPHERDHLEISLAPGFAGVTDRGLKRHRNEDHVVLAQADAAILVVCDGVSTSEDADQASKAAADMAGRMLASGDSLTKAFSGALDAVRAIPFQRGTNAPSTTMVAAVVREREASIGWLGDSRAYWIDAQGARQLTKDHSWMSEAVAAGDLTEAEALLSPQAHAITRWLGADVDSAEPSIIEFGIPGPGRLLLCTDGLWNYVPDASALAALLLLDADALTVARHLVEFAREQGGHDNITAAVLSL